MNLLRSSIYWDHALLVTGAHSAAYLSCLACLYYKNLGWEKAALETYNLKAEVDWSHWCGFSKNGSWNESLSGSG